MPQPALRDDLSTDQWMKVRRDQPQRGPAELSSYFGYQPEMDAREETQLRAQQAAERERREKWDQEHQLLLAPVFGPELLLFGAEAAGILAARAAAKRLAALPPQTFKKHALFPITGGDNWAARVGRRAHAEYDAAFEARPNWKGERRLLTKDGKTIKPDGQVSLHDVENPELTDLVEVRPNTRSGHARAARTRARYEAGTDTRVRVIYYDPSKYR